MRTSLGDSRSSHSLEGDVAFPANRQALPMMAIGSLTFEDMMLYPNSGTML